MAIRARVQIKDNLTPLLRSQQADLKKLSAEAYEEFKKATPVQTGNARRNTRRNKDTITADYGYAAPLDSGSSKKSPDGMSQPTTEYLNKRFKEIMNRSK